MPATFQAERRDEAAPIFSPTMFYQLLPTTYSKVSLSAGNGQGSGTGAINITDFGSVSSENWQLFPQGGRYFIRNYDYGAMYQLGLTEQSSQSPRLYIRNGKLEQQWTIKSISGGYQLINGLTGSGTSLNLPSGFILPAMRSDAGGETWNIKDNPSAAEKQPLNGTWLSEVEGFQLPSPSPSPSPSSSVLVSTSIISTATATFTAPILTVPTNTKGSSVPGSGLPSQSSGLAAGAIAGIAIGAVVFLGALAIALWFFVVRKRRNSPYNGALEVHGEPRMVSEKYAYNRAELAVLPAELEGAKELIVNRAELDSRDSRTPEPERK